MSDALLFAETNTPIATACDALLDARQALLQAKDAVNMASLKMLNELSALGKESVVHAGRVFSRVVTEEKERIVIKEA